jgi:hypothetical protein
MTSNSRLRAAPAKPVLVARPVWIQEIKPRLFVAIAATVQSHRGARESEYELIKVEVHFEENE